MEELVIKNSRIENSLLLVMVVVFAVAGAWMGLEGEPLGWMAMLLFGSGIPVFGWRLISGRPRLILDERGVIDSTLGVGRIEWRDIRSAQVRSIKGNFFICLGLVDSEKYLARLSGVKRSLARANRGLGFSDLNLNLSGVDANTHQILELVRKRSELARQRQPN